MDPFSALVAIALIIQLAKRGPAVVAEMVRAASEAGDNAEHKARIAKLADAGISPSTRGGSIGRHLGDLWREARLDADVRHAEKLARASEPRGGVGGWWDRQVDENSRRWAARNQQTTTPGAATAGDTAAETSPDSPGAAEDPARTPPTKVADPTPAPPAEVRQPLRVVVHTGDVIADTDRSPRGQVLVGVVAGPAATAQALTASPSPAPAGAPTNEGNHTMAGTIEVTGVASGTEAAMTVAREIFAATDSYVAALRRLQRQIHAIADQAHGSVQLGTNSNVIRHLADANEAIVAAIARAGSCGTATSDAMALVARAFRSKA